MYGIPIMFMTGNVLDPGENRAQIQLVTQSLKIFDASGVLQVRMSLLSI